MGRSRLQPEDKEYASKYAGCHFAEMKAKIKCLKKRRNDWKLRLKELVYFKKMLEDIKGYNPNSIEARKVRKRIYLINKEINNLDNLIQSSNQAIQEEIQARDKALTFLKQYKSKSD